MNRFAFSRAGYRVIAASRLAEIGVQTRYTSPMTSASRLVAGIRVKVGLPTVLEADEYTVVLSPATMLQSTVWYGNIGSAR
jgi:hypothetical protein